MMGKHQLETLSDEVIFEEAAKRLKSRYRQEHNLEFLYGTFRFVFHDGLLQCIEDCPRSRRYISPTGSRSSKGAKYE